jgi:hypothetical protein
MSIMNCRVSNNYISSRKKVLSIAEPTKWDPPPVMFVGLDSHCNTVDLSTRNPAVSAPEFF